MHDTSFKPEPSSSPNVLHQGWPFCNSETTLSQPLLQFPLLEAPRVYQNPLLYKSHASSSLMNSEITTSSLQLALRPKIFPTSQASSASLRMTLLRSMKSESESESFTTLDCFGHFPDPFFFSGGLPLPLFVIILASQIPSC
ncbi:hypothetical protein V6Z11_A13G182200 [Gossypium hirsutum]